MDIATGQPEPHHTTVPLGTDVVHPIDAAASPGQQAPTHIQPGQLSGPTIDARDTTGEYQSQLVADLADATAAMTYAHNARQEWLDSYQAQALPLGGQIGDAMDIPPVPAASVPPAQSFLYPRGGDEPTADAASGEAGPYVPTAYHGDEPL